MKLFDSVLRSKVRPSLPGTKCCRDAAGPSPTLVRTKPLANTGKDHTDHTPRQHWKGPDASQLGNPPPPPQHLNSSLRPSPNNILSVIQNRFIFTFHLSVYGIGRSRVVSFVTGPPSTLSHHPYYSFVNPELDKTTSPPSCHRERTNPSSCGHPISGPRLPSTENLRSRQTYLIAVAI